MPRRTMSRRDDGAHRTTAVSSAAQRARRPAASSPKSRPIKPSQPGTGTARRLQSPSNTRSRRPSERMRPTRPSRRRQPRPHRWCLARPGRARVPPPVSWQSSSCHPGDPGCAGLLTLVSSGMWAVVAPPATPAARVPMARDVATFRSPLLLVKPNLSVTCAPPPSRDRDQTTSHVRPSDTSRGQQLVHCLSRFRSPPWCARVASDWLAPLVAPIARDQRAASSASGPRASDLSGAAPPLSGRAAARHHGWLRRGSFSPGHPKRPTVRLPQWLKKLDPDVARPASEHASGRRSFRRGRRPWSVEGGRPATVLHRDDDPAGWHRGCGAACGERCERGSVKRWASTSMTLDRRSVGVAGVHDDTLTHGSSSSHRHSGAFLHMKSVDCKVRCSVGFDRAFRSAKTRR